MKTQKEIFQLCDQIRETAFALHCYLKHGHVEKVYENGLVIRLRKRGIQVEQQHALQVRDELKACKAIVDEHVAQLLDYLRGCRIEHGLLINFGSSKLEVRKYILNDAI